MKQFEIQKQIKDNQLYLARKQEMKSLDESIDEKIGYSDSDSPNSKFDMNNEVMVTSPSDEQQDFCGKIAQRLNLVRDKRQNLLLLQD